MNKIDVPENTTEIRDILKREPARFDVASGRPGVTSEITFFDKRHPVKATMNSREKIKFTEMLANLHARDSSTDLISTNTGINVVDNVASSMAVMIWGMVTAAKNASISILVPKVNAKRKRAR